MTYEVQQTRWDRLIRRVSGSIGPGSRVSETISELFPVLDVERVPGELLFLGGIKISMGSALLFGSAGETSKIQLFNPADSGNIIAISRVVVTTSSTNTLRAAVNQAALPDAVGNESLRDTRVGNAVLPVGQILTEQVVAGVTQSWTWKQLGNVPFIIEDDNSVAVLAENTGFTVGTTAQNQELHVSFFWRERPAEPSELQF